MNYESMSDEELSSELMTAIHGEQINHWCLSDCETYVYDCGPTGEQFHKVDIIDINNPAHMWPIIVENKIDLVFEGGFRFEWEASHTKHVNEYDVDVMGNNYHANPLRAAAIAFLMMKEAER